MMPPDRVFISTATVGTGASIVFGPIIGPLFMTPAEAGMVDGQSYEYVIEQGNDWEQNKGVYSVSGNSIARGTPIFSRVAGVFGTTKITLDGTAVIKFPNTPRNAWEAGPRGCCMLNGSSSTTITLYPFLGNSLWINGKRQIVPAAGVTKNNSGLAANTAYLVYAFMSSATVMALEISTTTFVWDSVYRYPVKSGDSTRTLVGQVLTDASAQFTFSGDGGFGTLRSWWNDYGFNVSRYLNITSPLLNGTTDWTEVHSSLRAHFLVWNGDVVNFFLSGLGYQSGTYSAAAFTMQLLVGSPVSVMSNIRGTRRDFVAYGLGYYQPFHSQGSMKLTGYQGWYYARAAYWHNAPMQVVVTGSDWGSNGCTTVQSVCRGRRVSQGTGVP